MPEIFASQALEPIAWASMVLAWAALIRSGLRFGFFARYRWVYLCVTVGIVAETVSKATGVWAGLSSLTYFYTWFLALAVSRMLEAVALLSIFRVFGPFRFSRDWHLGAVPVFLIVWALIDDPFAKGVPSYSTVWICIRLLNASHAIVCYVAVTTSLRMAIRRDIQLGWNLKGALLALSVPLTFQAVVFVSYMTGMAIPYDTAVRWNLCVDAAFWILMALAMRDFSPPFSRLDPSPDAGSRAAPKGGNDHRPFLNASGRPAQTVFEPPRRAAR